MLVVFPLGLFATRGTRAKTIGAFHGVANVVIVGGRPAGEKWTPPQPLEPKRA